MRAPEQRAHRRGAESLTAHAAKMVRRNFRSYAMLSITIVLSFSVLLGYLLLTDSDSYNRYKYIFSTPREVIVAYTVANSTDALQNMVEAIRREQPDTYAYVYSEANTTLNQYGGLWANVELLPANETTVFGPALEEEGGILYARQVKIAEGKGFPLARGEAILNRSAYGGIFGTQPLPVQLDVPITLSDGTVRFLPLTVVGIAEDASGVDAPFYRDADGAVRGTAHIYASQTNLTGGELAKLGICRRYAFICSDEPEKAAELCSQTAKASGTLVIHAVCTAQAIARENLRAQAGAKSTMVIALFAVLSFNLFGCFSNALNARRFEIGVKRAIGARAHRVVGQFLLEGFLVTFANILASVLVVTDIAAIRKLYLRAANGAEWIVYLSPHSAAQFAVCSVSMTVLFSLVFAYMATQVQIVDYLKAE